MEAKEIHEGHWLLFNGKPTQIDAHDMLSIYNSGQHHYYEPIPLTDEWFLNYGFEIQEYFRRLGDFLLKQTYDGFAPVNNRYAIGVEINYVHQLQDLYLALKGQELTIQHKASV